MFANATELRQAFEGIAEAYSSARPQYPWSLWESLRERLSGLVVPHVAIDVGSGTGISTRQLASTLPNWQIVGIEPGADMLAHAVASNDCATVEFIAGVAEAVPLDSSNAGLVVVAQSLQWFDRPDFYAEAQRLLVPHGLVAIMQNSRDWQHSQFLDDYEAFLERHSIDYSRHYRSFDIASELAEAGFIDVTAVTKKWTQSMTHAQFIELANSSTKMKAAIGSLGECEAVALVKELLNQHYQVGTPSVTYVAELYIGQRSQQVG